MTRTRLAALAAATTAATAGIAIAQTGRPNTGTIGPKNHIQPSGRKLSPAGKLTPLGNHPGRRALTRNGRFLWVLDAGRGHNDIRIVDAAPDVGSKTGKKGNKCRKSAKKRLGQGHQTDPNAG